MDSLNDVATFPERPHGGLSRFREMPLRRTKRLGEAEAFELLHARDHGGTRVSLRRSIASGAQVDNSIVLGSFAGELTV